MTFGINLQSCFRCGIPFLALFAGFLALLADLVAPAAERGELWTTFSTPNVSTAATRAATGTGPELLRTETFHQYSTTLSFGSKIPALFYDKDSINFRVHSMTYPWFYESDFYLISIKKWKLLFLPVFGGSVGSGFVGSGFVGSGVGSGVVVVVVVGSKIRW